MAGGAPIPAICGLLPLAFPQFAGCFPCLTRLLHLLWVAAGEPDNRAEKEQADAAAAEESPTVITSAGPEAPKLDLAGMLSPGAAPRAPRSVRPLGPGGRSPCGLCISPYAASPPLAMGAAACRWRAAGLPQAIAGTFYAQSRQRLWSYAGQWEMGWAKGVPTLYSTIFV